MWLKRALCLHLTTRAAAADERKAVDLPPTATEHICQACGKHIVRMPLPALPSPTPPKES